jgi:hypothetical protein
VNIVEATDSYERWLRQHLSIVLEDDLAEKHERMAAGLFDFLRATYYRWLQQLPRDLPAKLTDAPTVAGVGDLHVENFGCWRDASGDLAWGVNDFDEPSRLPYTFDLLRLCSSALVAIRTEQLPLHEHDACRALLDGYRESLASGGRPFAVDAHPVLKETAERKIAHAHGFWQKLKALPAPEEPLPPEALSLLDGSSHSTLHRRTAGLGSLGHRRVVAVTGHDAREVKELAPPATVWLGEAGELPAPPDAGPSWTPDPSLRTSGSWRCRRLAPDAVRLELADYARGDERRLLHAMGFETANVHQRSDVTLVRDHAAGLDEAGVRHCASALVGAVEHDWRQWAASSGKSP